MVVIFGFIFPFQKRKLTWSEPDNFGTVPPRHIHHLHEKQGNCQPAPSFDITCLPTAPKKWKVPKEETIETPIGCWAAQHEFTKTTGPLSRPSYLCSKTENKNSKQPETDPPSPCGRLAATQDSSVSTSANITTDDSP